jgi:uncharacterized membrane protein YfcA
MAGRAPKVAHNLRADPLVFMPHLTLSQWLLAFVAALGMGVSKAGFAGMGLAHVVIFAFLFGARESTGIVLPMLLVGDLTAVGGFRRHARWDCLGRLLPSASVGVVAGALLMRRLSETAYKPLIGWIILVLTAMQLVRMVRPAWLGDVPHARPFAWTLGLTAGVTTMLANAGGPIMALYFLAVSLPKLEFVGTTAWFFFIINAFKVPFSVALGLIHGRTLALNLILAPAILIGVVAGRWMVYRVSQRLFDGLLLAFAAIAALRLIGA